jgi:HAD superfamily phosphoserine phosphatase-like hydrolase
MKKSVIIFDICGTLFDSNTTFDFLDFLLLHNSKYNLLKKIKKNILFKVINKLILKLTKFDLLKVLSVKFLKNYTKEELEKKAEEFYMEYLKQREKREIVEILTNHVKRGDEVVFLSATLDFLANTIAREYNVPDIYSSRLQYKNKICGGKVELDLLKKKEITFKNEIIKEGYEYTFYTDNTQDYKLLQKVHYPNVILTEKNKKFFDRKKLLEFKYWVV